MIATIEQLKQYLGMTSDDCDAVLGLFLDGSNQIIESFIGRTINSNDYVDIIDGAGQLFRVLPQYPVTEMTSVEYNTGTIASPIREVIPTTSYSVNYKIGKINFLSPMIRGFQNYRLTYTAGYETIPADLVMASLKLASKYYQTRNSDGISSESNAGDSITFDATQIPNDILVILSQYRSN